MALNNCSNSGQGKHENKLTTRFPVSFQVKFKTVSTSYTVQAVSNDSLPVPIKRNHNCSSNRHAWLPDASEKSKPTFPNRQTKFTLTMPTHIPLSTNNLNTKFHCAFSAMTVTISLSLSTPVPTLPGKSSCFRLQSQGHQSVRTSVKPHCSCTLPNLRCSTTHVLSQKMWQLNQGH